ncbi:hypothetical protein Tco_0568448 [Tanacetum coccineum]
MSSNGPYSIKLFDAQVIKSIHGVDGAIGPSRLGPFALVQLGMVTLLDFGQILVYASGRETKILVWCLIDLPIEDWVVFSVDSRSGAESSQFQDMMETIRQVPLTSSIDKWKWDLDASGFTVSSTRSHIDDHYLFGSHTPTGWSRLIPIKANVLVWRMCLDKLSTLTNLDKKGRCQLIIPGFAIIAEFFG